MSIQPVETAQAEQYGTMLMSFLAHHRIRFGATAPQSRRRRPRLATDSGLSPQLDGPRLVLPYLVSVLEEFLLVRLRKRAVEDLPDNPLVGHLWSQSEAEIEASWERQKDAWKNWYEVIISDFPEYQILIGYREARHAIIHGLGNLTPRQMRGDGGKKARERLQGAGVQLKGAQIQLDESHLRDCAHAFRSFITWLDFEAQCARAVAPS